MNIFIVDDHEESRYLLEALLRGSGHNVHSAANGADALERLKSERIDLIVSDILMPIMDGFALCRKVRADEGLRHIPFIIYTATYTGPQDEAFAYKIGADRFIQKPCEPDVLIKEIRDVMSSSRRTDISSSPHQEEEILRLYSERLVRKLEQKMLQLEKEVKQRQEAEETLRNSEEQFKTMFNMVSIGIAQADPITGKWLRVNRKMSEITGYASDELIAMHISEITHPEDRKQDSEAFENVVSGKLQNYRMEKRYIRKDDTIVWVNVNMTVIRNAAGQPVHTIATIEDISDRKQAEEKVQSMARFPSENPNPVLRLGRDGTILYANSASQILLQNWGRSVGDRSPLFWQQEVSKSLASQVNRMIEVSFGDDILSFFISPIAETDYVNLYANDITERKKTEDALRKSEAQLRTLVQTIPDLIWVKDPDGVYIDCNPMFEHFFGAAKKEIIGKTDYEFVDRQLADFFREKDREAIAAGKPRSNEEWVTFAYDGHRALLNTTKTPMMDEKGNLLGVVGIARDITEQENIKKQLIQAQKMESVGRLAGGVAHDFNNKLAVIIGFAELALDKVNPSQTIHADLEEIRNAASQSAVLTRQLLAFARKQTICPEVIDLNETIEGMLKMLRRLIGEDIDIAWLPDKNLWLVKMDPSQIDQILANLCVNARDAISGVGKMTIETGNRIFDADYCAAHPGFVPGEYVKLNVSDNGCGMDKETQLHIFEPFFTTKELGKGTGLGLATVYGIVKQNEGFINVYSEPEQGTTFAIYLSRHISETNQSQKKVSAEPAAHGNETILLVEDEPKVLEMTRIMLEMKGYTVLAAPTPGEAIRLAETHPGEINLIMTDVVMPDMNGRDLVRNLLPLRPNLKSLFMSGYTANVIAHHGVLDEGVIFIQKPFSNQELASKVREALCETKYMTSE